MNIIKQIRTRQRLTQVQIAYFMGVSKNTVWRWENNREPFPELRQDQLVMIEGEFEVFLERIGAKDNG